MNPQTPEHLKPKEEDQRGTRKLMRWHYKPEFQKLEKPTNLFDGFIRFSDRSLVVHRVSGTFYRPELINVPGANRSEKKAFLRAQKRLARVS